MDERLAAFREKFLSNTACTLADTEGFVGRICKGWSDQHFDRPSGHAAGKRLSWVVGPEELCTFSQQPSHTELALSVGWDKEYICRLVESGCSLKLLVCTQAAAGAVPTTWSGMVSAVASAYPELEEKAMQAHVPALESKSFEELQVDMAAVKKAGKTHPYFMDLERFLASDRSLFAFRSFLFHEIACNQYFSGDGYSVTADGQRSGREYVMPNLPLTSIAGGYTFIDLDVTAPSS